MKRRALLSSMAAVPALAAARGQGTPTPAPAKTGGLPRGKITRVRIYEPPTPNRLWPAIRWFILSK